MEYFLLVIMLIMLFLAGCSSGGLSGSKPPEVFVKIGEGKLMDEKDERFSLGDAFYGFVIEVK